MFSTLVFLAALVGSAVPAQAVAAHPSNSRTGIIVGTLRLKGCSMVPAGAVVTVIGHEASSAMDAAGHFTLTLPPGMYSLIIDGPGLVADQRVDDVNVTAGLPHDLGTIEVWPDDPPAGCSLGSLLASPETVMVAIAPGSPAVDLPGRSIAPILVAPEQVWARGGGGSGPGQFGFQGSFARDDEDALGPPTFALGPQGALWVFDALNSRVMTFDARGRFATAFPVARHGDEPTVEADMALSEEGRLYLYRENDALTLSEYDLNGKLLLSGVLPPSFKGIDLLFTGRSKPIFLMLNGQSVKADLAWGGLRSKGPLPGLPTNGLFVHAERLDRWRIELRLSGADGHVRRSVQFHSFIPVTSVRLVGVDRHGQIFLAVDRSEGADRGMPKAEVLLFAVDQHGHLTSAVRAPPGNRRFEFREFALAPDGAVVQMQSDAHEVRFVRWALHPLPREARAGEGLVRGRITEGGRGVGGALITVAGKRRHSVTSGPDGSFELRLSAGNWVLWARRGGSAHTRAIDPRDSVAQEVKVSVAAGATIDVGTVALMRPPPPRPAPVSPPVPQLPPPSPSAPVGPPPPPAALPPPPPPPAAGAAPSGEEKTVGVTAPGAAAAPAAASAVATP